MSTSDQGDAGASSAGLKTTQLPNARAGAIFHAGIASGKFHGVMMPDDAHRLARHLDLNARANRVELVAADPHRLAGEILEDGSGPCGLAHRIGQGLPLLARQLAAELLLARQDLRARAIQDVESLLRVRHRPFGEGLPGGSHGVLDIRGCPAGELANDVLDVRGVDVWGAIGRLDGAAVNQIGECGSHGRYHFSPREGLASESARPSHQPERWCPDR